MGSRAVRIHASDAGRQITKIWRPDRLIGSDRLLGLREAPVVIEAREPQDNRWHQMLHYFAPGNNSTYFLASAA